MKLKILFFPITLILSLTIVIWFIKPQWVEYKAKKEELSKTMEEKQQLEKGMRSLSMALDDYELMDEDSKSFIMNAIPKNRDNDDFIAEIHKNVMSSSVFLVSTKLKEVRAVSNRPKVAEENEYVSPELKETVVEVEVIGEYLNVKSFIEEIDMENRFSMPNEVLISKINENKSEEEDDSTVSNLVKARIIFSIHNKKKDAAAQLSKLNNINDKVVKSLLSTGLRTQVIDDYQKIITPKLFKPVSTSRAGKQDLFAK
ncbi:MAG: hypothetical protein U9M90_01595 [Patescibacteria group bacterium]|nr:hypothetical protein [Patescibacteria group bacterium]